jgi:ribosomal protein L11 methyltransferase
MTEESWKVTILAPREIVQAALLAHEDAWDWDPEIVIAGTEVAPDRPEEWQLEAWLSHEPSDDDCEAIENLFPDTATELVIEKLPDADWVTLSQQGVTPITEGPFHVHTPDFPAVDSPEVRNFIIPASRAFGTGHHETTAGCLAMLSHMKQTGVMVRNLADIGTGTGLLAFAAMHLWPRARAMASDIDHVCGPVVTDNAIANDVPLGDGPGKLAMVIAPGMDHPLLSAAAPYDLLIANILAGPLVELAPDFARSVAPGGHVLLAGLLEVQEDAVRSACRRAGLRLAARMVRGDWSILWLRRRGSGVVRSTRVGTLPEWSQRW